MDKDVIGSTIFQIPWKKKKKIKLERNIKIINQNKGKNKEKIAKVEKY